MQTDAYVLDPRFQIIGVGVKAGDAEEPDWHSFNNLKSYRELFIEEYGLQNRIVCCHHTLFDGFITTQRLGIAPKFWLNTLDMARAIYPYLTSHSLANLAKFLGIGEKGTEVIQALGMRLEDFTPRELRAYGEYCKNDVALTHVLAKLFIPKWCKLEAKVSDMTIRMFTEPSLIGDVDILQEYYDNEVERKKELLRKAELEMHELQSSAKFAARLEALGVMPPKKLSLRTGKETYAFSKTDKAFTALLQDDNPEVSALVAARLGAKTTIGETRSLKLLETAQRGSMPVYLNYWGAKTTGRHSGGNSINWQNIPARGDGAVLRKAMVAPRGYCVVVGDSANIELRVAMAVAGQIDVLKKLESGIDLYCDFASDKYGRIITKEDKMERFLGKLAMLSLQYGAGGFKFGEMVRVQTGSPISIFEATDTVDLYRDKHFKVVELWKYCQNRILPAINNGELLVPVDVNGWVLTTEHGFSVPGLPGVQYYGLHRSADGTWMYQAGRELVKLYGGKVMENLCQHIARHIVMWQTARINERFKVAMSVHDEVVCVVPIRHEQACIDFMTESLSLAPKWCRGQIPLACEVHSGPSYGDAK